MPGALLPETILAAVTARDALALALLVLAWALMGRLAEHPPGRPSVTVLMADVRREWMREFLKRGVR